VTCTGVSLSPGTLPAMTVRVPYDVTITASGGAAPYTFVVTSGALPAGVSLSAAGRLSGTPKNGSGGKTYTFAITARDANTCPGSATYTVFVAK
jgi:hypothetical protein